MCIVKKLGVIFLALYLILINIGILKEAAMPMSFGAILPFLGIVSGILLLVSLGHCCGCCSQDQRK